MKSSSQTSIVSLDQGIERMKDGWILTLNLDFVGPLVKSQRNVEMFPRVQCNSNFRQVYQEGVAGSCLEHERKWHLKKIEQVWVVTIESG